MKFQLISKCGEGAQILYLLHEEGNEISIFIKEEEYRSVWAGLINHREFKYEQDTIYIFDSSGMGMLADKLRKYGCYVFGASQIHDKLENDRDFGAEVMKNSGIKIPLTKNFNNFNDAKVFVRNDSRRWVFKPCGDVPSKLTYVSSDTEDLIQYLNFVEKFYANKIKQFILQEFIKGVIASTEAWFDGTRLVRPFNTTVEVKKLMNDDIGPATGCSGNTVWLCENNSKIVENGIGKIEKFCVKHEYIGPIDINTIVSSSGVFGLEWTPRFGLDAFPTLLQMYNDELGKLFSDFARKQFKGDLPLENTIASGVRLSIPPYPLEPTKIQDVQKVSPNIGIPIRGIKEIYKKNLYFYEIMRGEEGLVHSGGSGVVFTASDLGNTVEESFKIPYKICEEVKIPDKQYRTDLPKILNKMREEVLNVS